MKKVKWYIVMNHDSTTFKFHYRTKRLAIQTLDEMAHRIGENLWEDGIATYNILREEGN